jgi:hypothetical protein
MTSLPPVQVIDIDRIITLEAKNPNVMGTEDFQALVRGIRTHGFLIPLLVYPKGDQFVIIDGVHRYEAACEVGLPQVTAVVLDNPTPAKVRVLRLALNKLRGQLDNSVVATDLQWIQEQDPDMDLELSGYCADDCQALLDLLTPADDDLLSGLPDVDPEPTHYDSPTFQLTVKFSSEVSRAEVRGALEKVRGDDLEQKLRFLLELP